jgi:urease accessory protein
VPNGLGTPALLLALVDGRFPAGGYAHSGGLEPAVTSGHVQTVDDLEPFLLGRLRTTGLVTAAVAAAACREVLGGTTIERLAALDSELDARTPSPAQRATSRQLGRQLVRAVVTITPQLAGMETGHRAPHLPVALGVAFGHHGLSPYDAALACLHESAAGVVAAAVRVLSTDPFVTYGVLARLAPVIDELAGEAVDRSADLADLPADSGPLQDTNAERHRTRATRLFAS